MTVDSSEPLSAPIVRFISDVPADDDFFDTHTNLAEAIVKAIEENPEIKVVGLLGRWGSGKSTVAKKIIGLTEADSASGFRVFPYDAWLHQSDPIRRSFLESLIRHLVDDGAIEKGRWSEALARLNSPVEDTKTIETPHLSSDGRWIGLSLLAVPVGVGLINLDTIKEAFGASPTNIGTAMIVAAGILLALPLIVWTLIFLSRRRWNQILDRRQGIRTAAFWRIIDEHGQPSSPLRFFIDGTAKHTSTRTFRSAEPTSLEFGRVFQEIMQEAATGKKRLIILIDNLDRIAEDEALGMWATIRSFFLASHETEDVRHEAYHPTVILPIDRHAIEELFAGAEGSGRERARSFMDKTFDVTFEVTEPVSSDWRAFLEQQMAHMFGSAYQSAWGFWTRRLFESQIVKNPAGARSGGRKNGVTPREINKLLNRIGALYLQWRGEGIPVEVMSLYVIHKEQIDDGVLGYLKTAKPEVADVAPEWQAQVAAIHYGVPVSKAAQVLLEEPIRNAILRNDHDGFEELSKIPGFGEIFEFTTSNLPDPRLPQTNFDVLIHAVDLLDRVNGQGEPWRGAAWRNLTKNFVAHDGNGSANVRSANTIAKIARHAEPEMQRPVVQRASEILAVQMGNAKPNSVIGQAFKQASIDLIRFSSSQGIEAPTFDLDVEPDIFIQRLSSVADSQPLWPQLRTSLTAAVISEALVEMTGSRGGQLSVTKAIRCLRQKAATSLYSGDQEIDFEGIAARADQVARSPADFDALPMPAIQVLAELSYFRSEGRERLAKLVDDGIVARLLKTLSDEEDWVPAAELVALLLWRRGKFDHPTGWAWPDVERQDASFCDRVLTSVQFYFPGSLVPILWGARRANLYPTRPFIEDVIGLAVSSDRLGNFDPKPVLKDLVDYKWAVPTRWRDRFMAQVEQRRNFLDVVNDEPLGPQMVEVVKYLRKKGGELADKAEEIVRRRVEEADAATWIEAIQHGKEPYSMASKALDRDELQFGRRSGLFDALNTTITDLLKNEDRELRRRWFSLTALIQTKPRRLLMEWLAASLGEADAKLALLVLRAGGIQFLKDGGFNKRADQSVKDIILSQLQNKAGRDWLKENADYLKPWVNRAEKPARKQLADALASLLESKLEERRYSADRLMSEWGLAK